MRFFPLSPAHRAARQVCVVPGIAERTLSIERYPFAMIARNKWAVRDGAGPEIAESGHATAEIALRGLP
jgi:hypothetical protein